MAGATSTHPQNHEKALIVFDSWDTEKYWFPEFHRNLFKDICSRRRIHLKGYATLLDVAVSEAQGKDAEEAGITLIPGKRNEYIDPKDDPIDIRWLFCPESYYKDLKALGNIKYVIGYAPFTAGAAAYIRKTFFSHAKLYLINALHPDYHAKGSEERQTLKKDMLRMANEADAMVSIGPSIHDYFENAYRAVHRTIPHIKLLPKTEGLYRSQEVRVPGNIRQLVILSYGEFVISPKGELQEFDKIAASVERIAAKLQGMDVRNVTWIMAGVPAPAVHQVESYMKKKMKKNLVEINIITDCTARNMVLLLQQCHVCLIPQCRVDYGFFGLESISMGVPAFLNPKSQLGYYMGEHFTYAGNSCLVRSDKEWDEKIMSAVQNARLAYKRAKELRTDFMASRGVEESYARFASLLAEDSGVPSDGLSVSINLDDQGFLQLKKNLKDQLDVLLRQCPDDDSKIALVEEARKECMQLFKENADTVVKVNSEEIRRLAKERENGVNNAMNTHARSLGMLVNFLGILYLYRFKSACHNGRFAKAFEPLLITDEMRELAERFNIPLKLKATYDQQQFDAIDHFFCQRDGLPEPGDRFSEQGVQLMMPGDISHTVTHRQSGVLTKARKVRQESLVGELIADTTERDIDVVYRAKSGEPSVKKPRLAQRVLEAGDTSDVTGPRLAQRVLEAGDISDVTDTKLLAFKTHKAYRFVPSAEMYLPTIFNVDNYTALRRDQWDFIQFMVKMTEKIQHILSTRQEILSVLGVREFFVTDTDCETHDLYGLADQFLKHGRAPLCIKSSAKPYSLSARSLIPYKVSHTLVDQKGQRSLELDLTDRNEALKLALTQREEEIAKLRESLSSVENTVRQLKRENTAESTDWQNKLEKATQGKNSLEVQLENAKQEVVIMKDMLNTEKENLKRAEKVCTKATLEKNNLEQRLESAEKEAVKVQDMNKIQQTELVRADEKIASQLARIKELESKAKQSEISRVDKSTCTPSLPEKTLEQISEAMSTEKTSSTVEPQPVGGTDYIGEKESIGRYGGSKWTLQVLGSRQSGTEPGQFNYPRGLAWHGDQLVICDIENHRIQILNKNKVVIEIIRFDGQFDKEFRPYAVAISPDGHFFITDISNNQIIVCDQNKEIIQIIPQSADIKVGSVTVMAAFILSLTAKVKV
ncbi:uncharacterized protein [Ptychodera flava]|uniref:uncharacterized protein n=1 Tax=Ptychodera flava TaxID=63121 RepID=UPI00396A2F1E